jgi:hypothetical protein
MKASKIVGMGGGFYSCKERGDEVSCFVEYTGKAAESVARLRQSARFHGLYVKTWWNCVKTKNEMCHRLNIAGNMDKVVTEMGFVMIEFAQQHFDAVAGKGKE